MKKFNLRNFKLRRVTVQDLDDRLLLVNLYATQALMLIIGTAWLIFQGQNPISLLAWPDGLQFLYWGSRTCGRCSPGQSCRGTLDARGSGG